MVDSTRTTRFHQIVASQAVLGEMVGIQHYARMIPLARTSAERLALLEDAWRERAHLKAMQNVAVSAGALIAEPEADPYWSQVRAAFDEKADVGDLRSLYIIQDVVLESYAVVLYEALVPALAAPHSETARQIGTEERGHLAAGVRELSAAYIDDPEGTVDRVDFANERVGRVLSGWVRVEDCTPVCGVCGMVGGECAKDELRAAGVDVEQFQPAFADLYGSALREAGLPVDRVARWLARLLA